MEYSPQLVMLLDDLTHLPVLRMPVGYTIRSFQPGDEGVWEEIMLDSFAQECHFAGSMAADEQFKPERVLFACCGNDPVATASAWYNTKWDADTGYLHMVGTHSSHAGKGLGLQVSLAALHQMAKEGRRKAVLQTDDFRIPAIKTYIKLKFVPHIVHENQVQRWKDISLQPGLADLMQHLVIDK